MSFAHMFLLFFFFNDTATTEIYTLSLHDALPISGGGFPCFAGGRRPLPAKHRARVCHRSRLPNGAFGAVHALSRASRRSEEHTSELQSRLHLVCRLLLEKKKKLQSQISLLAHSQA